MDVIAMTTSQISLDGVLRPVWFKRKKLSGAKYRTLHGLTVYYGLSGSSVKSSVVRNIAPYMAGRGVFFLALS